MRPYFVKIGQRWQHLWLAGSGAPLLLLHGSPTRALSQRPLIEALAKSYLVIAPDTPGNGYSDPLPGNARHARDYATAALSLMDALQVRDFGVYGYHTGAVVAAEIAIQTSNRVRGVVCDGFPMWTKEEVEDLGDEYLPNYGPESCGAHLTRLWGRVVDQNLYFPWHKKQRANAVRSNLNEVERLHDRAIELLDAGSDYRQAYQVALHNDGETRIRALSNSQIPTLLICDEDDVLDGHRERVPQLLNITSAQTQGQEARLRQVCAFFDRCSLNPLTDGVVLPESERRYVQPHSAAVLQADEWLYVEMPRNGSTIWLHDLGESHRRGPGSNVRLDLPGHGYSTAAWPRNRKVATAMVAEAIEALGLSTANATGRGLGRQIAETFAKTTPSQLPNVGMPDLTPGFDGGHLLRAWHYCRLRSQYPNWQERDKDQRRIGDMPNPEMLHQQTIDLLRAGADTLNRISAENLKGNKP